MRVAWWADNFLYTDEEGGGGAELEDFYIIDEGLKRRHEITRVARSSDSPSPNDVDLCVFANIADHFNKRAVLDYSKKVKYVKVEHDLRLPRQKSYYTELAGNSLVNVFHSPTHRDEIFRLCGTTFKHFLHPMCLSDKFRDLGLPRVSNPVLYVGGLCYMKGRKNVERWVSNNKDKELDVYGLETIHHPRIHYKGWAKRDELIKIYNSYDTIIFLPVEIQGCSRVLTESFLCRIPNIICNKESGFKSYGWTYDSYDEVRNLIVNGAKIWWDKIEHETSLVS